MSEYQYYEFQAIDRPLNTKEMDKLRSYSTRARITPTSFVNDYSWGDFKGDEDAWMENYFDAFLYLANWGTHILKLRLPTDLLPSEIAGVDPNFKMPQVWRTNLAFDKKFAKDYTFTIEGIFTKFINAFKKWREIFGKISRQIMLLATIYPNQFGRRTSLLKLFNNSKKLVNPESARDI